MRVTISDVFSANGPFYAAKHNQKIDHFISTRKNNDVHI
jgi:hypothetical protein